MTVSILISHRKAANSMGLTCSRDFTITEHKEKQKDETVARSIPIKGQFTWDRRSLVLLVVAPKLPLSWTSNSNRSGIPIAFLYSIIGFYQIYRIPYRWR